MNDINKAKKENNNNNVALNSMFAGLNLNMNRLMGGGKAKKSSTSTATAASAAAGAMGALTLQNRKGAGKRKAEEEAKVKMEPHAKKRSALGDLTNAVKRKGNLAGGSKEKQLKLTVVNAKCPLVPLPSVASRTRSSKSLAKEEVVELKKAVALIDAAPQKENATTKLAENNVPQPNASKLPVRQPKPSRSRSSGGNERKSVVILRRSTRSSTAASTAATDSLSTMVTQKDDSSMTDDDDNDSSLYKTACSSPDSDADEDAKCQLENQKNDELSEEKKRKLPDGVIDFDEETGNDAFQVGLYAEDIFAYYRRREGRFPVEKYLDTEEQSEINRNMRAILVDWMAEVQESFELNHETMYLAVKLVDLYLGKQFVKREKLQLIGATCLYIAAKYDERCPPAIDDFCYICDDAYGQKEILEMEGVVLRTMNFDIGMPLSYRFLRRYSRCAHFPMDILTLARYVLEMSLMEYEFIDVKDSMIAASALLLALVIKEVEDPWTKTLEYYTGYKKEDLFDLTHRLHNYLSTIPPHLKTIRSKYSHKVFYGVAKIPLPEPLIL